MSLDKIRAFRDDWEEQELREEIDEIILNPLQDFEDFLISEIKRHEMNKEYHEMYATESILAKFRERLP